MCATYVPSAISFHLQRNDEAEIPRYIDDETGPNLGVSDPSPGSSSQPVVSSQVSAGRACLLLPSPAVYSASVSWGHRGLSL